MAEAKVASTVAKKLKVLIVLAHPEAKSFNHAMCKTAQETLTKAGHEVKVSDLHAMKWNPVPERADFKEQTDAKFFKYQNEQTTAVEHNGFSKEIKAEMDKLTWCDVLILQFPLWWFSVPAIMKGWFDKVLAAGFAYGGSKLGYYGTGGMKGKKALCSLTTGGPGATYAKGGWNGDIMGVLRPVHRGVLEFCGFEVLKPEIVYGAAHAEETRVAGLKAWTDRLTKLADEKPCDVGQY